MMDGESVDESCHGILKGEANELHTVFPTKTILHQFSHPHDDSAFPRAGKAVQNVQERRCCAMALLCGLLFQVLYF